MKVKQVVLPTKNGALPIYRRKQAKVKQLVLLFIAPKRMTLYDTFEKRVMRLKPFVDRRFREKYDTLPFFLQNFWEGVSLEAITHEPLRSFKKVFAE